MFPKQPTQSVTQWIGSLLSIVGLRLPIQQALCCTRTYPCSKSRHIWSKRRITRRPANRHWYPTLQRVARDPSNRATSRSASRSPGNEP